ncbi:MAG TPA: ELM1/GtrOC1 family putative glycosyltransferase [Gammaproteobacteria bacterium]|nr:ELM1/GtrOC1 family putative glycosyltransferase [Gammaproteobacteria bacterium]
MAELTTAGEKRIWLVIGDKTGDNAQVEIIAEALGLPFEIRRVLPREKYILGKPPFKASLYHLDPQRSDKLEPPWPDLILTIGRRPAMAALWIQQQSGGRCQIVLLGRPKRWMRRFNLIIAPSQYLLPASRRVLPLGLPLIRSNQAAIAQAVEKWRARLSTLPRPLTALMVGGETKPFRFDAGTARELLEAAQRAAGTGFLYITTSRRTPPAVVRTLQAELPANARLYCWSADNRDNPYLALLGLADRFIVTGDSMSMMVEVARLGKPLAIFALPYQRGLGPWLQQRLAGAASAGSPGKLLLQLRLLGNSRDLTAIHRQLYDKRLAVPLGHAFLPGGVTPEDELQKVVGRIKQLITAQGAARVDCMPTDS